MSKKSDGLVAQMLSNRWVASMTTVGASCSATCPAMKDSQSRAHLELIWYSIKNLGAATGITVSAQVRGSGGTVVSQTDHFVGGTSVTVNVAMTQVGIPAKRGQTIGVFFNTTQASVTQCINIAGWIEDDNG